MTISLAVSCDSTSVVCGSASDLGRPPENPVCFSREHDGQRERRILDFHQAMLRQLEDGPLGETA